MSWVLTTTLLENTGAGAGQDQLAVVECDCADTTVVRGVSAFGKMSAINFSESLDRYKESFLWVAAQSGNSQGTSFKLMIITHFLSPSITSFLFTHTHTHTRTNTT